MTPDSKPFYITTAISYPNGRPHIGHAYEAIATDAIARFHRLAGRDVRFQTGVDEHGLKMVKTARERGMDIRDFADEMTQYFIEMNKILNIQYDRFIRTTEEANHRAAQEIWRRMEARGDLYLDRYEGWYSVRDEAYYDEKELIDGEGDEKLSPQGTPVEWTVEESWFFKLSNYQDKLLELYENDPEFLKPDSRRNEIARFVESGLRDLSISRTSFDWGVKVPGHEDHVMYVWLDALTNYLTGLDFPDEEGLYARYWGEDAESVHIIGKDIVRFHTVYWPAFLMSADLPLPSRVFGHGFLLNRGQKESKSLGNVTDPIELAETFGVDSVRYFLLSEVSFGRDGSYSAEAIVNRCNADLANDLGNLAQRTLSMIAKNFDGKVPEPGNPTDADCTLMATFDAIPKQAAEAMDEFAIHQALEAIWRGAGEANLYISEEQPWSVRKTDPDRAGTILYRSAEAVRQLAILARWAIPASADALLDQLAQPEEARDFAALGQPLKPELELPAPQGVFPRLELPEEQGDS
ncbi:methionine--tRNA ligase [Parasphingopyxis algicola]|uniref:methionine--tRNA ligase n=1 Tax=Parasphingopyxis algicola TaxID=2026624 RepID=UPI0015A1F0BE|nr:methionine--tRNA ligase [Parasphingopyxis algicola]QLC24166.1 methionine--tRNA ligase [Parasphingopyxis algicola]